MGGLPSCHAIRQRRFVWHDTSLFRSLHNEKPRKAWASRGLVFFVVYFATESSTRRFFWRPSRVLLSAAGDSSP